MGHFLANFRFLLVIAAVGCLAVATELLLFGAARVLAVGLELLRERDLSRAAGKQVSLLALEIIDLFLIATVAYLTAVGIYTLFVRREVSLPTRIGIESLDDLKEKIIGVLIVALAVLFLGQAASTGEGEKVLQVGGGVALVIASLAYFLAKRGIRHDDAVPNAERSAAADRNSA